MTRAVGRALRTLRWLAADGLRPDGRNVALALAGAVVEILASSAALALPLMYVARASRGAPIALAGHELPSGGGTLVVWVVACLTLGLVGALAGLQAERRNQEIARRYQRRCALRVLALAARPDARALEARSTADLGRPMKLADLATSSCLAVAFALRALARAVPPLVFGAAAALYLVWLDPALSAALLVLAALHGIPWLSAGRAIGRHQQAYRAMARPAARRMRRALERLTTEGEPLTDPADLEWQATGTAHARMQDALYGRYLATAKSDAVTGLFSVTSLCIVLLFAGFTLGADPGRGTHMVAFVVGLRVVWRAVRQLVGCGSQLSRFLPDAESHAALVRAAAHGGDVPEGEAEVAALTPSRAQ